LEQVRRDQVLLWGALEMFADEHDGNPPSILDELVPRYLAALPSDPFQTVRVPKRLFIPLRGYTSSKGGEGYQYLRGASAPDKRAWVIASVGGPDFPYLAAQGNVGPYLCKGTWISGVNPTGGSTGTR